MDKGDIQIKNAIVHILDASLGMVVYSDVELDFGSDFADFLKEHICRVYSSDDVKNCHFSEETEILPLIQDVIDEKKDFISMSKEISNILYRIMQENPDIPSADVVIVYFEIHSLPNLAILKMNYKESYTHATTSGEQGNVNSIVRYRSTLPACTQKLSEAAIINLTDFKIRLLEKKYEINGVKENYFSGIFLNCSTKMSQKAKLTVVEKAVEAVQKEFLNESEQFEEHMKAKSVIHQEIEEQGSISIPEVAARVFENNEAMHEKFREKIEKYNISEEEVIQPQNENTTRKFEKQHLTTDTGIEIKIPMEQYNSTDNIEFMTNEDGTISVLIKNIGHITSK
ncbi:MAG: nucleoid-associated protein [Lachnospiraceae bacterium]|nr:nucleoid-associated protein [Lachnospiraceae bacterium]